MTRELYLKGKVFIIKYLILIVFALFQSMPLQAASTSHAVANIDVDGGRIDLLPFLHILIDHDNILSIKDVTHSTRKNSFQTASEVGNSFGFTEATYWARFRLPASLALSDPVLLQIDFPHIDDATLFIPDGRGGFRENSVGDKKHFSTREIEHRTFLFTLPEQTEEIHTYYLRFKTEGSMVIPLLLWNSTALISEIDTSNFVFGIYYGIMLLLMLAALTFYIKFSETLFLFYAFYLFSFLIFQLTLNGFSFQYLWPNQPWLNRLGTPLFVSLVVISGLLFSGKFLQIWEHRHQRVKTLFYGLIALASTGALLALANNFALGLQIATVAGVLLPPTVLIGAISSLKQGYKPAKYFLLAWSVFLAGVMVAGLLYLGFLPHTFITNYAMQIGSTFEVLLLGYAVMSSIDVLFHQRNQATKQANKYLNQLNEELETLVEQRTTQLGDNETYLRTLIETMPDLVWLKDVNGTYQDCNSKFEDLAGLNRTEIIGKTDSDLFSTERADFMRAKDKVVIATGHPNRNEEHAYYASDDHEELIETLKTPMFAPNGKLVGILGVGRDITERRASEQAIRRSQKLSAIGQLTGGIAHDFNNILGIILGNVELLKNGAIVDPIACKQIEAINTSSHRAAELTRQLLGFSRQSGINVTVTDINALIMDMEELINRTFTAEVDIRYRLDRNQMLVEIDHGDFQDSLLNLILNARDALPNGGQLILKTCLIDLTDANRAHIPDLVPGAYVKLSVTDNGVGILPHNQEHLFEPFFTTKAQGKGTGLGLAMVFGFVERSKGYITVSSKPEFGTTFCLFFPIAPASKKLTESIAEKPACQADQKTILVVDDESALQQLAAEYLTNLDYRVLTAQNSKQALKHLYTDKSITVLFSDVLMPGGMDGYALAEQARNINPKLKVLLTTGYTSESNTRSLPRDGLQEPLLKKPYKLSEMAELIRKLSTSTDDSSAI